MDNLMYSLRIVSHGKITSLSKEFILPGNAPFTVFVVPKGVTMDSCITIDCQLVSDTECGAFPVPLNDWTPGAIKMIAANGIDLDSYDVYWGAGSNVSINS